MTQENLKQAYNRRNWQKFWLADIFGVQMQFETQAENVEVDRDNIKSVHRFASVKLADGKTLAVLDVETHAGIQIARNRVALRNLVEKFIDHARYHGILAFYHSEDAAQSEYRMSFISSETRIDETGNFVIEHTASKRYTYLLGKNAKTKTPADRLKSIANKNGKATLEDVKNAFSVTSLNKEFFEHLVQWYQHCLENIQIDLSAASEILKKNIDNELKPQAVIRVIIRMMFIWFMKEKGLLKSDFFTRKFASDFLKNENTYYNAILQNMFFAVLNKKIDERRFRKINTKDKYDAEGNEHGVFDVFRYKDFFNDNKAEEFLELTKTIPFVNGGLFQCHDYKFIGKDAITNEHNKEKNYLIDGFSETKRAKISDDVVFELIDLFNDYVFTIEENTPQEQNIALDPELLGTVFENLIAFYNPETKDNARKQTGSFYTPREIVDYMCKESFKETLLSAPQFARLNDLHEKIQHLIDNDEDYLDFPQKSNLIAEITNLKILDPACGSGAFPMGMFNLMVRTIEKLQEHKTTYKNKLDIITNCIYGVDKQNIAVEISKLRFFISLLVDYQTPENIENFEVLPNLETKFVVADTLIGIDLGSSGDMFENALRQEFETLTKIFLPFTTAKTPSEKTAIRNAFEHKKKEIINTRNFNFAGETKDKISEWNPFNVCYCSPFFDSNIMFGIDKGFDIVIGNPPYVQLQNNGGELAEKYAYSKKEQKIKKQESPYKTFARTGDIYCLFYERGCQLLKPNGHLCFITSNKWMRAGYGENTRKFLSENTNPSLLVDFAGVKVFESATVDTNILMFSKDKNRQQTQACIVKKDGIKDLSVFVRQHASTCNFSSDSWVILSPIEQRIKAKIEAVGTPLKDWDINIYRGILTGYNEAFIIDGTTKEKLIAEDPKSEEIIRPILRGRDIKRYGYEFADKYLICARLVSDIPNNYPAICRHLEQYKGTGKLGDNSTTKVFKRPWWSWMQEPVNYWEDFYRQKIMYSEIVKEPQFYLDKEGKFFPEATTFILTGEHLEFLYKAFHTKVVTYFFKTFYAGGGLGEDGYRYKKKFLENLPIPRPTKNIDFEDIEKSIYELYQLSEDEIQFIENQ